MGQLASYWSEYGSPDAVAAVMLKRWPPEVKPRPAVRTLGNRLRDLDHGKPEWWSKETRQPVVHRLAVVLKLEDDDLAALLRPATGAQHSAAVPLATLGQLRPLRLDRDDLFPGLPSQLLAPESWTRHWWGCTDPRTRELVAAWHTHRARTAVLRHSTWADALDELPRVGRVLLVLDHQVDAVRTALPEFPGLFLCVVAPYPVVQNNQRPTWTEIPAPRPQTWIADLAAWVLPRGHTAGGLRTRGARIVDRLTEYAESFSGPRDALELCGLLEEIGSEPRRGADLARRHVELLWRLHDPALAPRRTWLREHGFASLVALAEAVYYHHGYYLLYSLPRNDWEALVPNEAHARSVEQAYERLKLARSLDPALRAELLSALEPGPRYFLDDLCTAGILVTTAEGRLRIDPPWLAWCLLDAVREQHSRAPLTTWAERLTSPVIATDAIRTLVEDWQHGRYSRLDEILDAPPDTLPRQLALDACLRSAGVARLLGADLPRERVALLWRALPAITRPIGGSTLPQSLFTSAEGSWWLDNRGFALAVVLLSEMQSPDERGPYAPLWQHGLRRGDGLHLLDPLDTLFRDHVKPGTGAYAEMRDGLLRLGARWLAHCGEFGRDFSIPELLMPAWLVQSILGTPSQDTLKLLRSYHLSSDFSALMQRHCELHGLDFAAVAERCWRAWQPGEDPDHRHPWFWIARDRPDEAQLPWRHLPPDLICGVYKADFLTTNHGVFPNAWRLFGPPQWQAWLDILPETDDIWRLRDAWRHMPDDILVDALDRGLLELFSSDADATVWSRMHAVLLVRLGELRLRRAATVWRLVRNAPPEHENACLDLVLGWLRDPSTGDHAADAAAYLRTLIARRSTLAPQAWAVLRSM